MKRSEINALMRETIQFVKQMGFHLPPFAFWTTQNWRRKGAEADEIRDCMLGWDLTDFGGGDFHRLGLILFTLRNGRHRSRQYSKPYAEKIMVAEENQKTPMHFHWSKAEDIIVRGGGNLMARLYNATPSEKLAKSPVTVAIDGVRRTIKAGGVIRLTPGESICLTQRCYHEFWAEPGKGKVLLGEVSMVNDDRADNRFLDPIGRFPEIEEDAAPLHLLCNEYPTAAKDNGDGR